MASTHASGRIARALLAFAVTGALAAGSTLAAAGSVSASPRSSGARPHTELFPPRAKAHPRVTLPPGFTDTVVISGRPEGSVVQFAADGRVYIGDKAGRVWEYDSIDDTTPLLVKDLSTEVYDWGDRGLLGMALDPNFTTGNPYIYVLYTLDAPIGQQPPVYNDTCTNQDQDQWCLAGARLARFKVKSDGTGGAEQILLEDWCQQFPSHSIGTLAFGPDGALYVGGGDGGSYNQVDYGQLYGNPCGDPNLEGGALRAQDDRTYSQDDPTGMNGAILRVDPATGNALPDNPLVGNADPTDDRIIAFGMRNPYRFTFRPGTDRIFIGDVGWFRYEELDRITSATDSTVEDFGWPCYEGMGIEPEYQAANLPICNKLYAHPKKVTLPLLALSHGTGCSHSNVFSGISFYEGGGYPTKFDGALFMADVYDACMWWMKPKPNGDPNVNSFKVFATGLAPVDLKLGPGGDIYYMDWNDGSLHRISYSG
jgi:glucose/arabinose dehydrogenase